MARFAKLFALVSAAAMVAFAGPALATEARYTCSDGSKLTAQFSPPDTAKGSVALTFGTGVSSNCRKSYPPTAGATPTPTSSSGSRGGAPL